MNTIEPAINPGTTVIDAIRARLFQVPLKETLSDARYGDHTHFELVTATVALRDGLPVCSHGMQELHVSLLAG